MKEEQIVEEMIDMVEKGVSIENAMHILGLRKADYYYNISLDKREIIRKKRINVIRNLHQLKKNISSAVLVSEDDILPINAHFFNDYISEGVSNSSLSDIFDIVCLNKGIESHYAMMKVRDREVADTRFLFYYFAFKYTHYSLSKIGQFFSNHSFKGYHHATVLHGKREAVKLIETGCVPQKLINDISNTLEISKFVVCR